MTYIGTATHGGSAAPAAPESDAAHRRISSTAAPKSIDRPERSSGRLPITFAPAL